MQLPVTLSALKKDLSEHPFYPSLLSVNDVLNKYRVSTLPLNANAQMFPELPFPFIVQIKEAAEKNATPLFAIVEKVENEYIQYYNPLKRKWEFITKEAFYNKWTGIVLLTEGNADSGERNYKHNRFKEIKENLVISTALLFFPITIAVIGILIFLDSGIKALYPNLFLLVAFLGSIVSGLLIWYDYDQYNPIAKQICGVTSNRNCHAVLKSKASKVFGISWSSIGFVYFFGQLLLLLLSGVVNSKVLLSLSWLNLFSLPYILFSLYYQFKIAKQWCFLCILIQVFLFSQFTLALAGGWVLLPMRAIIDHNFITAALISFFIPFIVLNILSSAYHSTKDANRYKRDLQKIKYDTGVFNALLSRQKSITKSTDGLGLILGKADATHKIVKVCNPYCQPCADAHIIIEELLNSSNDVQVQIIFMVPDNETDIKIPPVKHLLALAEKKDSQLLKTALDDWYLNKKKDYNLFAAKYPLNGELDRQTSKLRSMHEWCKTLEITFTPTIFLNGYQLPANYNVTDLKYLLLQ
jgi:uncharacterized membrane protein